jgi:hypothetical protein
MNWKAKVAVQFALAHLPFGETVNHRLQRILGRYTPETLRRRILARLPIFQRLMTHAALKDATVVEIGTGWELLDPLLMFVFGSKEIYTYDHVRHLRFAIPKTAIEQMGDLKDVLVAAGARRERLDTLQRLSALTDLLAAANIHYIAPGDAAATGLPAKSVDLFFSISVLEHVPTEVLFALIVESRRILKSSGVGFHIIDPGDHYADLGVSKVNFLQYSDRTWDFWVQNKISYHNRLRAKQFIEAFKRQGASFKSIETKMEPQSLEVLNNGIPLQQRFADFTKEELAIHYCEIIHSF